MLPARLTGDERRKYIYNKLLEQGICTVYGSCFRRVFRRQHPAVVFRDPAASDRRADWPVPGDFRLASQIENLGSVRRKIQHGGEPHDAVDTWFDIGGFQIEVPHRIAASVYRHVTLPLFRAFQHLVK